MTTALATAPVPTTERARGAAARAGARDMVPLLAGVAPFAVVIALAIRASDVDVLAGWAGSIVICAGAAQLAVIELLDRGAAPLAILFTVLVINLRFVLYSAGLARWFGREPLHRRLLLAMPVVDQLYVLCEARFADDAPAGGRVAPDHPAGTLDQRDRLAYYVAAAAVLVGGWTTIQALALVFASAVPDPDLLALAAPLTFAGLLAGTLRDRPAVVTAIAGGAAAVLATNAPAHSGLLVAIVVGLTVGSLTDRVRP